MRARLVRRRCHYGQGVTARAGAVQRRCHRGTGELANGRLAASGGAVAVTPTARAGVKGEGQRQSDRCKHHRGAPGCHEGRGRCEGERAISRSHKGRGGGRHNSRATRAGSAASARGARARGGARGEREGGARGARGGARGEREGLPRARGQGVSRASLTPMQRAANAGVRLPGRGRRLGRRAGRGTGRSAAEGPGCLPAEGVLSRAKPPPLS